MSFEYKTIEEAIAFCREKAAELGLNMNITDAEYNDDKTTLTFFFTASERLDLRELVKSLAHGTGCRIEVRQIRAE